MVERIERHDVINAALLAAVLLGMALVLLFGARSLFETLGGSDPELIEAGATTTTPAPTTMTWGFRDSVEPVESDTR